MSSGNYSVCSNILPAGGEILFEVFDRVGTKFMGCNIVSVDEIGEEKNRFLPLKSRRMEMSEQITGNIEVQVCLLSNYLSNISGSPPLSYL